MAVLPHILYMAQAFLGVSARVCNNLPQSGRLITEERDFASMNAALRYVENGQVRVNQEFLSSISS